MAKSKKLFSVTMDANLIEDLKKYSKESLIPMSALISRLVETFLNNQLRSK